MGFLRGIQSGVIILIMLSIGYALAYKKVITEETGAAICKIVVNVSLPALMFTNLLTKLTLEEISSFGVAAYLPFLTVFINYISGVVVAKFFKIPERRSGIFAAVFGLSNTIFMGLPVSITLFGNESIPFALLYYLGNTTFFWTLGVDGIKRDGIINSSSGNIFERIKKILSPPLLGFIAAVIILNLRIKVPGFMLDTFKYIANLSTPLSIFFIGSTIYNSNIKNVKFDKETLLLLFGRFIFCPLTTFIVLQFFNVPTLMRNVFIIQSAMPAITQSAITAKNYSDNGEYGSIMVVVTTIASLIFTPIYMIILSSI